MTSQRQATNHEKSLTLRYAVISLTRLLASQRRTKHCMMITERRFV